VGRIFFVLKDIEFRLKFGNAKELAAYSGKLRQVRINLKYIESVEHLIQVIEHEMLHKILWDFSIAIKKEHKLIDTIQWANYLI
tara:strand:- start:1197 stop:1448 length:252 start_codon:yes stop_codon:yes gene_type:complete